MVDLMHFLLIFTASLIDSSCQKPATIIQPILLDERMESPTQDLFVDNCIEAIVGALRQCPRR